jgi:hypothetical protein
MAIKRTNGNSNNGSAESGAASPEASAPAQSNDAPKFRENAEVNAKIDAYIEKNPKEWAYIQSMPRERLERSLVLQSVQKQERMEKMRAGIRKKLEDNPEMKAAYQQLVKDLPAEKQEAAILRLASQNMRALAPQPQRQTQGARV